MIDLQFSEQALVELQRFIRHYEEAFFELYQDSGVWSEALIIQNYKASAEKLYLTILQEIETRLSSKKVLGRKSKLSWQELYFYVGNRLIIVTWSDDQELKKRFIQSIFIDRKPIIF